MKAGILIPRSSMYPQINFDLMTGIKEGLKHFGMENIEVLHKGINFGEDSRVIYKACEELIFDGVNVIAGYFSYKVLEDLESLLQSSGVFLIHLDMGYSLPVEYKRYANKVTLTLEGCLAAMMSIRRQLDEGHKSIAECLSYYDSGYRIPSSVEATLIDGGTIPKKYFTTKLKRTEFNIDDVRDYCEQEKDKSLFVSMCCEMAEDFVREWQRDPMPATKLIGSPMMGEEYLLDALQPGRMEWDVVVPWASSLPHPENQQMVKAVGGALGRRPGIFSVLAWEAAILIAEAVKSGKPTRDLQKHFEGFSFNGPRGKITLGGELMESSGPLYNGHVAADKDGKAGLTIIGEATQDLQNQRKLLDEVVRKLAGTNPGWMNAYICI